MWEAMDLSLLKSPSKPFLTTTFTSGCAIEAPASLAAKTTYRHRNPGHSRSFLYDKESLDKEIHNGLKNGIHIPVERHQVLTLGDDNGFNGLPNHGSDDYRVTKQEFVSTKLLGGVFVRVCRFYSDQRIFFVHGWLLLL